MATEKPKSAKKPKPPALLIYPNPKLLRAFEIAIMDLNESRGNGRVVNYGDKKKATESALRAWIAKTNRELKNKGYHVTDTEVRPEEAGGISEASAERVEEDPRR